MRLAQVARNLSITTEDIVAFLAKKDINIIKDSNTKLDQASLDTIYAYYGKPEERNESAPIPEELPDRIVELEPEQSTMEEDLEAQEIVSAEIESKDDKVIENYSEASPEQDEVSPDLETSLNIEIDEEEELPTKKLPAEKKYKTVTDLLEEQESNAEALSDDIAEEVIIKAPKVNLQGLNIVGKIDLPEPREKKEVDKEERPKKNQKRKADSNRPPKRGVGGKRRNELSPQEVRAREKKAAERKRKAEEEERKKQREAFYKDQVLKPKQEQQKKKQAKKKQLKPKVSSTAQPLKPAPKSALGKFWRWLNT